MQSIMYKTVPLKLCPANYYYYIAVTRRRQGRCAEYRDSHGLYVLMQLSYLIDIVSIKLSMAYVQRSP